MNDKDFISDEKERNFWGIHKFSEGSFQLGCLKCGWGQLDPIHDVKEEDNV